MTIAAEMPRRLDGPSVGDCLPRLRAASLRLLTAVLRLSDAELALPARSGLGTRRHVVARMARRADRTTRALAGDEATPEPADRLLDLPAADLTAALTASLGGVLGTLREHASDTLATRDDAHRARIHAIEHLAWLELSHVDLGTGYDMHDVPETSLDAIAEHFRAALAASDDGHASAASPFAPLMSA